MRHGKDGICGSRGNVESASYRLQRTIQKPNPTLSADKQFIIINLYNKSHVTSKPFLKPKVHLA